MRKFKLKKRKIKKNIFFLKHKKRIFKLKLTNWRNWQKNIELFKVYPKLLNFFNKKNKTTKNKFNFIKKDYNIINLCFLIKRNNLKFVEINKYKLYLLFIQFKFFNF